MDPMHDDTFETTRETYNDLVTRINEARAAYSDASERMEWALRCLEIHRLQDADGTQRVERTRVQSALELAFCQWVEAERPHFERTNDELRELLKQEDELILRTANELASPSMHMALVSEDHESDEAETGITQQNLNSSMRQAVNIAPLGAVLSQEILASWQKPFQRWVDEMLKPLSRTFAQLNVDRESVAAFQKLAKAVQLAAAGPALQIGERQQQAIAESMRKMLEAIQANFSLKFDYFTDLYKVRSLQINKARYEYYLQQSSRLSDADYDRMYREVEEIEEGYPELRSADSPTMTCSPSRNSPPGRPAWPRPPASPTSR